MQPVSNLGRTKSKQPGTHAQAMHTGSRSYACLGVSNFQWSPHREKGSIPRLQDETEMPLPSRYLITPCRLYLLHWGTSAVRLTPVSTGRDIYYSFYPVLVSAASTQTRPFNATLRAQINTALSTDLLYSSCSLTRKQLGGTIHFRTM